MTLLEVLLGVLLLTLVAALAFSIVLGASRAFERQADWAARIKPASETLDVLVLDLAGAMIPETGEPPYFRLAEGAAGSELRLVTAAPPADPALPLSRFRVLRVEWRLEADDAGRPGLVRVARPERAAGEVVPERFRAAGVTAFTITVYNNDLKKWVPLWLTGPGGALPAAARVELTIRTSRGTETLRRDAVIPAGLPIGR
jgi:hypothetical protein